MNRLTDQTFLDETLVAQEIERGTELVIQYSKPIYSRELLTHLDRLCERHGDKIEIRFYGHYEDVFDFRILAQLPHVQRLAVNCLTAFSGLDALFTLPSLRHLSFGAYADVPTDFLAHPNFAKLRSLSLGEAKAPSIDLSPVAAFSDLEYFNLVSHYRGIDALGALPKLGWLGLSQIKKSVRLDFVSRLSSLRTLRLILGGRDHIHEVSHPTLQHLEIIRVRGFSDFRPDDFPRLHFLQIEDQIQLPALHFGGTNPLLAELRLLNCKGLSELTGLEKLSALEGLRISRTAISFEALLAGGLPPSLNIFAFYTKKTSLDKAIRKKLDALGYAEFGLTQKRSFWK